MKSDFILSGSRTLIILMSQLAGMGDLCCCLLEDLPSVFFQVLVELFVVISRYFVRQRLWRGRDFHLSHREGCAEYLS